MRVLLQARTDDALRGRVFSAYQGATSSADFCALWLGGLLVEALGPRPTLATAGTSAVLVASVAMVTLRRTR